MAITSVDGVIAGARPPSPFFKTGTTMPAVGARRLYTPWYAAGSPGASTAGSAGVNGEICTPSLGATVAGQIYRANPGSGNAHLARFTFQASSTGAMWLVDRIWQNSGLSATLTTAQSLTSTTLTNRDRNGSNLGHGIWPAIEWSATGGAGVPTVTLSYTNQDGTSGRSATLTGLASPPVGTIELFDLQSGDTGIRSIQSYTASATRTSGTFHLILFRVLAIAEISAANMAASIDAVTSGMPRLYDNTTLQTFFSGPGTSATNFAGTYVETWG